ncbi:MAG: hypothetical protein WBQ23_04900 [Bacteroidota bacterium]
MNRLLLSLLFLLLFFPSVYSASNMQSGDRKSFRASDGASVGSIVSAMYTCVSGPAGAQRDWKRFRALFIPEARLEAVIWRGDGNLSLRVLSVEEYVKSAESYFTANSFYEKEIVSKVDRFGSIAQVFSTYEAFTAVDAPLPIKRGINSIQLFHDGNRWWIASIMWDDERPGISIPPEYLSG